MLEAYDIQTLKDKIQASSRDTASRQKMTLNCPLDHTRQCAGPYRGYYCAAITDFDASTVLDDWRPSAFLVANFLQHFNQRILFHSELDAVSALIACEIWLFNNSRLLQGHGALTYGTNDDVRPGQERATSLKCNTFSLAQSMELPSETVRRKVTKLVERGIVLRDMRGALSIAPAFEAKMKDALLLDTLREFVGTAQVVFSMNDIPCPPPSRSAQGTASTRTGDSK